MAALSPTVPVAVHLVRDPGLSAGVREVLRGVPDGVQVSVLVREVGGGSVLEALQPDQAMIPASTQKLVTAASVLVDRGGAGGWWSTELTVPAAEVGQNSVSALTLRGGADPTLSVAGGPNSLRSLAKQAFARGLRRVNAVRLDESQMRADGWTDLIVDVPMTAVRLSEWANNPPLSAQEARARAGAALVAELRRAGIQVGSDVVGVAPKFTPYVAPARGDEDGQPLPPDPLIPVKRRPEQGLASVRSGSPAPVLAAVLRPSDNLKAEELLGTLAATPLGRGTLAGALLRERAALRRMGVDLTGIELADGSGLSRANRLTARALVQLLSVLHDLPYAQSGATPPLPAAVYRTRRNAFAEALPQAGTGDDNPDHTGRGGTMALRLQNSGLDVRAKTGTLPGVSALAGYVTAKSGKTLAFSILMNGPETTPILTLRGVQDQMVRAVAAAH
ncbi:D-alanyl-D-alanine carboxypeptidase/D-alanyl-D-alanine-endopeptidase [Deinococcus sp. QL22]|uniref:D-alanyl-D-alanine carboxypeptidase/D-alanyl-D-alanine-endopeptidase n=1 Tax=Deinococcus sp. QL22 TaxID=2939437 RepID=UPI0020170B35|nr:D-alanyl-D-alanine carboxypeptidase [Deinococcus sp. QL22]UQN07567.1 D-alanyl-D-alanine carboxypeptidase [Deinococcus sp. QL22]